MKTPLQVLADLSTAPVFSSNEITKLMKELNLNEKGFSLLMNVTPMTVKLWISGAVSPCGLSRRLLQIYKVYPEIVTVLTNQKL